MSLLNNVENKTNFCSRNTHFLRPPVFLFGCRGSECDDDAALTEEILIQHTEKNINWKSDIFFFSTQKILLLKKKKKKKIHLAKNEKKKNYFNYFFSLEKKVSWKKRVHWFFLHCVWHMENNVFIYHLYSVFLWKQIFPSASHLKKIMISFLSLFHGKKIHLAQHMNKNFLWILLIHNINYSIFCSVQNMTKIVIFFPYTVTVHLFFEKSKKKLWQDKWTFFFSGFFFTWKKFLMKKKSLVCSVGN